MAYAIEPKTTKEFIAMRPNLPRFQRKQTWKPLDNFKLCISVFKNYPIGVVIINKNDEGPWLLDGRQRLNALKHIDDDPIEVYRWAMKFVRFKSTSQPDEIRELYWDKVNEYLQQGFEENVYSADGSSDNTESISPDDEQDNEEDTNYHSFDPNEQKRGLNDLLNLILMVHGFSKNQSAWERNFDFRKILSSNKKLFYYDVVEGNMSFNPKELIKTMEEILDKEKSNASKRKVSRETFVNYYKERYILTEKELEEFDKMLDQRWSDIEFAFSTINSVKRVLGESRIGVIEITAASDLDAQNIFSLVNDGGTQLTAEELLSAKPFWNIKVENPSSDVVKHTAELYKKLDIVQPNDVVRWDLCATLISRIDKNGIIFDKRNTEAFASQTTLGFKLFSALYIKGISSSNVSEIEKRKDFNWNTEFETLVSDLSSLCDLIEDHKYFKCLKRWGQSVMSLTSSTIALEFITLLYNYWVENGKPIVDGAVTRNLKVNAVVLLDKLIYEYSNRQWRGSSDSKLAADLNDMTERFKAKKTAEWKSLLTDMSKGRVNDLVTTQNLVKPLLFHAKCLAEEYPSVTDPNVNYDLDHIYPKADFINDNINKDYRDSLCNLEILSSSANKEKNDKRLEDISDKSIMDEISKSSGIPIKDFDKYSKFANIESMVSVRLEQFKKCYDQSRDTMLKN